MIRVSSRRLTSSVARQLRFQSTTTTSTTTVPVKSGSPVRKFFFRLGLFSVVGYSTAAVVAYKNDTFQDIFCEFVPYGEEVIDTIDYYLSNPGTFSISTASDKVNESLSSLKGRLGVEKAVPIPKQGVSSSKVDLSTLAEPLHPDSGKEATVESHKDFVLPVISIETGEKVIDDAIKSVNSLITSINSRSADVDVQKSIEVIKSSIKDLSSKYKLISSEKKEDLEKLIKKEVEGFNEKFEKEKLELTTDFLSKLTEAKQQIESKYNERLTKEVESTKTKIMLEAENIILKSKVNAIQEFNKIVSEKIENERNGKLKNLNILANRVKEIENFEIELSNSAENYKTYKLVKKSILNLQKLLSSNDYDPNNGKLLISELNNLKSLTKPLKNELIQTTIENFPKEKELLKTGGVLTQNQLITRWDLLVPELRSVALLPPNAGVLGHLSSWFFSKLLLSKSGSPLKTTDDYSGNDIESVIARVNHYLSRNELDNAVEEVANLKGWARKLSDDWIVASRKKLELQFLVDIIDTEVKVSL